MTTAVRITLDRVTMTTRQDSRTVSSQLELTMTKYRQCLKLPQQKKNAVLKSYFQQQGLSEDEVNQAIATFKQSKQQQTEQQQNNSAQLQNEVAAAKEAAEQAQIELAATKVAMILGIDAKTLPYVLKMADFSKAKGTDGKISDDNIKASLEQVLKDVPALKPSKENNAGFQIGAPGT